MLPLERIGLKIQGFQLTFSQLLNDLSMFAQNIEIETNAKNDLSFDFNSPQALIQERYAILGFKMNCQDFEAKVRDENNSHVVILKTRLQ